MCQCTGRYSPDPCNACDPCAKNVTRPICLSDITVCVNSFLADLGITADSNAQQLILALLSYVQSTAGAAGADGETPQLRVDSGFIQTKLPSETVWTNLLAVPTNGVDGATWTTGTTVPSSGTGANGDLFLLTTTDDVYKKIAGTWTLITNIKGAAGTNGTTLLYNNLTVDTASGTSPDTLKTYTLPANTLASVGDMLKVEAIFAIGTTGFGFGSSGVLDFAGQTVCQSGLGANSDIGTHMTVNLTRISANQILKEYYQQYVNSGGYIQNAAYIRSTISSINFAATNAIDITITDQSSGNGSNSLLRVTLFKI